MGEQRWIAIVWCLSAAAGACALPPDMSHGDAVRPYEWSRPPAPGVLGVGDPPALSRATAWRTLTNPRQPTQQVLEEGAELYRIYCSVCHGSDGAGQGPVAAYFRRVPDLRAPRIARYQDGRLYHLIRVGGFNMPGYASSLSADERWAVVHFVRTLGDSP